MQIIGGVLLKKIILISNIVFEPHWNSYLTTWFSEQDYIIQSSYAKYEDIIKDYAILKDADIVVVCLNFDSLYPNITNSIALGDIDANYIIQDAINQCHQLYSLIKERTSATIIWFGFEDYLYNYDNIFGSIPTLNYLVDRVNLTLSDIIGEDIYIDLKRIIAKNGLSNSYDCKSKYRWNAPYSKQLISLMTAEVYRQALVVTGKSKKCLILDCDNVIWGGVLSEDGIEGIRISNSGLGRQFLEFQQFVLTLYYHGVILAICSKNDEVDVLKVFREHSGMILKEEHISCFQCNWHNKAESIKTISNSLNIGIDSMVFVDDTIFELQAIKTFLPEITTILYNKESIFSKLNCFNLKSNFNIQTVLDRTKTYKSNYKREQLKLSSSSINEFISSLHIKIDIHKTLVHELARVSELSQRTNRCTNGVRYTLEQIKSLYWSNEYECYTICVSDIFSDLGIVGAIVLHKDNIELMCLSCRALGRNIEDYIVDYVENKGFKRCFWFDTTKNYEFKQLLESKCFYINAPRKMI